MRTIWAGVACLAGMAGIASGQEQLAFDIGPTALCVASDRGMVCAGLAASQCMERSEGGYTTAGMATCADRELQWWDARLNTTYKKLRARFLAYDADKPDYAPSQSDALREMQRAWIPYRDALCAFEASEWGGGTGAGPAAVGCHLHETARQTLYLEQRYQE